MPDIPQQPDSGNVVNNIKQYLIDEMVRKLKNGEDVRASEKFSEVDAFMESIQNWVNELIESMNLENIYVSYNLQKQVIDFLINRILGAIEQILAGSIPLDETKQEMSITVMKMTFAFKTLSNLRRNPEDLNHILEIADIK